MASPQTHKPPAPFHSRPPIKEFPAKLPSLTIGQESRDFLQKACGNVNLDACRAKFKQTRQAQQDWIETQARRSKVIRSYPSPRISRPYGNNGEPARRYGNSHPTTWPDQAPVQERVLSPRETLQEEKRQQNFILDSYPEYRKANEISNSLRAPGTLAQGSAQTKLLAYLGVTPPEGHLDSALVCQKLPKTIPFDVPNRCRCVEDFNKRYAQGAALASRPESKHLEAFNKISLGVEFDYLRAFKATEDPAQRAKLENLNCPQIANPMQDLTPAVPQDLRVGPCQTKNDYFCKTFIFDSGTVREVKVPMTILAQLRAMDPDERANAINRYIDQRLTSKNPEIDKHWEQARAFLLEESDAFRAIELDHPEIAISKRVGQMMTLRCQMLKTQLSSLNLLNKVVGSQSPECSMTDPKEKLIIADSCSKFDHGLDDPQGPTNVDRTRQLWLLDAFKNFAKTKPGYQPQFNECKGAYLHEGVGLTMAMMLVNADGSQPAIDQPTGLLAKNLLTCSGKDEWGGWVVAMERELRGAAKQCDVVDAFTFEKLTPRDRQDLFCGSGNSRQQTELRLFASSAPKPNLCKMTEDHKIDVKNSRDTAPGSRRLCKDVKLEYLGLLSAITNPKSAIYVNSFDRDLCKQYNSDTEAGRAIHQ